MTRKRLQTSEESSSTAGALLVPERWLAALSCTAARLCPRGTFSHVVAYILQSRSPWQIGRRPRAALQTNAAGTMTWTASALPARRGGCLLAA
jgi:hypothetical protein